MMVRLVTKCGCTTTIPVRDKRDTIKMPLIEKNEYTEDTNFEYRFPIKYREFKYIKTNESNERVYVEI